MIGPAAFLAAAFLALSCSLDTFTAAFAYGGSGIRIPAASVVIINLICDVIMGVSLFLGDIVRKFVPGGTAALVCFLLLFILGLIKLFDGLAKSLIKAHYKKHNEPISGQIEFSLLNFNFILRLYADPEAADVDGSKTISALEAVLLAASLSLDGIAVGFGAALGSMNPWLILGVAVAANMAALFLGGRLGEKAARSLPFDISWAGGAVLILLAFSRILL